MKAIVCDKCKKVITGKDELKSAIRLDLCTDFVGKYDEKHFCDDCQKKFYGWLKVN